MTEAVPTPQGDALRERRNRRLWQLGATLAVAAALVGAAIAISTSGGDKKATSPVQTRTLLGGIPQQGIVLGNPRAPVTMIEFADLECPFCRQYMTTVLPDLIRRYVRTGKVKMVFRNLAFENQDSPKGAQVAAAAGLQNKLWNVIDRIYQQQGTPITQAYVRQIAAAVPGLDARRVLADRSAPAVVAQLRQAEAESKKLGVSSTPTFFLQRGAAAPKSLDFQDFTVSDFAPKIDAALAGSG